MKKLLLFLIKCFAVVLLVFIFFQLYSNYLDKEIEELYKKNMQYINHINGLAVKDKGNALIAQSTKEKNILLMGSSELSSPVRENISNFFPNNLHEHDITMVGHASVQNALHAINLGANYDSISDNPVMIVESLQWFMGDEIHVPGFFSNFSELQFYEFLHNDKISDENKLYLCKRYIQLEYRNEIKLKEKLLSSFKSGFPSRLINLLPNNIIESNVTNKQTLLLARLYSSDNFLEKTLYQLSRPYYWLRNKILCIKDKYQVYQWLKKIDKSHDKENININWEQEYKLAEEEGKNACTNNNLFVYDEYYDTYLKEKWDRLHNTYSNTELMTSTEWADFEFFLKVCSELNIKPYIVIMSTNGLYYDYTGLDKVHRDELYNKIEKLSSEYNFDVLNLKNYEYEPYFYCDVMHLGWKGWTYVTQKTIEHFSK